MCGQTVVAFWTVEEVAAIWELGHATAIVAGRDGVVRVTAFQGGCFFLHMHLSQLGGDAVLVGGLLAPEFLLDGLC
jgi:hypothetical protein